MAGFGHIQTTKKTMWSLSRASISELGLTNSYTASSMLPFSPKSTYKARTYHLGVDNYNIFLWGDLKKVLWNCWRIMINPGHLQWTYCWGKRKTLDISWLIPKKWMSVMNLSKSNITISDIWDIKNMRIYPRFICTSLDSEMINKVGSD